MCVCVYLTCMCVCLTHVCLSDCVCISDSCVCVLSQSPPAGSGSFGATLSGRAALPRLATLLLQ